MHHSSGPNMSSVVTSVAAWDGSMISAGKIGDNDVAGLVEVLAVAVATLVVAVVFAAVPVATVVVAVVFAAVVVATAPVASVVVAVVFASAVAGGS